MHALQQQPTEESPQTRRRFDRVSVCSIWGNPSDPKVWSAAPFNLANALERLGIEVARASCAPTRPIVAMLAMRYALSGYGIPSSREAVLRTAAARWLAARRLLETVQRQGIRDVLHTGILDVPIGRGHGDIRHYLYCDDDWALSYDYRPDKRSYSDKCLRAFAAYDRQAMANIDHVFTFSRNLRRHMIAHYGLPQDKVTAVGCGMGEIEPYYGPKYYGSGRILFVAKHLFAQKGGLLLLEAFRIARRKMPHLTLTIVGDSRSRELVRDAPGVELRDHLPWNDLQELYRHSALLAQPMLNDPWGQVYVEALASRTPVLGLHRKPLPPPWSRP
ncbi:MAG: glycosyltransferase family 4 protein [Alphaproteobacteria bacterium]|nr:glycosyltransferase family 4 protein [Alphaproteobacteria bacterium]